MICGGVGISDAYYCKECTILEKDRGNFFFCFVLNISVSNVLIDGCPKIVNLGTARTDLFYERKKYGFKKH